jgi:hypothetical protein
MLVLPHNSKIWIGADDGRIWVLDGVSETLLGSFKPHAEGWAMTALAVVGKEVWSASERCLAAHDPETGGGTAWYPPVRVPGRGGLGRTRNRWEVDGWLPGAQSKGASLAVCRAA